SLFSLPSFSALRREIPRAIKSATASTALPCSSAEFSLVGGSCGCCGDDFRATRKLFLPDKCIKYPLGLKPNTPVKLNRVWIVLRYSKRKQRKIPLPQVIHRRSQQRLANPMRAKFRQYANLRHMAYVVAYSRAKYQPRQRRAFVNRDK